MSLVWNNTRSFPHNIFTDSQGVKIKLKKHTNGERLLNGHFEFFIVSWWVEVKLQMKFNLVWRSLYLSVMLDVFFTTSSHLLFCVAQSMKNAFEKKDGKNEASTSLDSSKEVLLLLLVSCLLYPFNIHSWSSWKEGRQNKKLFWEINESGHIELTLKARSSKSNMKIRLENY